MKKSIFAFLFIFMFYGTAFAEKEEWIDKDYNFSNAKAIDVEYCVSEDLCNGIKEKETAEIFHKNFVAMLNKKLSAMNVSVNMLDNNDERRMENNINAGDNADLIIKVKLLNYTVGASYSEGYSYTTVVPRTSTVYTPSGPVVTTTTETKIHNKKGRDVPTVYVNVRFDIIDTVTDKVVWSRIDNRSRQNEDEFDNTKPRDVFNRILKDFKNDFQKRVEKSRN